jgi:hypothetical protein
MPLMHFGVDAPTCSAGWVPTRYQSAILPSVGPAPDPHSCGRLGHNAHGHPLRLSTGLDVDHLGSGAGGRVAARRAGAVAMRAEYARSVPFTTSPQCARLSHNEILVLKTQLFLRG